ncbi:unnamed protein product, partial [Didymodactylos carnosus]
MEHYQTNQRTKVPDIYNLIVEDCGKPSLIMSVYGGAKYFELNENLEKKFMKGIVQVATIADAWILTTGLNSGVSKLVGDGISSYRLLSKHPKEVVAIGLTQWGSLTDATRKLLKQ